MNNSSAKYYDALSSNYQQISSGKRSYINSINQIIAENTHGQIRDYLDIGCGDGLRTREIIELINPGNSTLVDNSKEMISLAKKNVRNATFQFIDPLELSVKKKYNLITSLWNVIGHFPDMDYKARFFEKISNLLSEDGVFVCDVNNRFNIRHYGWLAVATNFVKDIVFGRRSGYFQLRIDDKITSKVYIHKPNELEHYFNGTGLRLHKKLFVNYSTGKIENRCTKGQLVYLLKREK